MELTEDIWRVSMTSSNEKYEETSYFTVKIHKAQSSNAFFPSFFEVIESTEADGFFHRSRPSSNFQVSL